MSLAEVISENIFLPRVKKAGCLVVYDPYSQLVGAIPFF